MKSKNRRVVSGVIMALLLLVGCAAKTDFDEADIKAQITDMLAEQDKAWNAGDIDGFMAHYWQSPHLRFASGGKVKTGWQATLSGYKARYPDQRAMGHLQFCRLEITPLSPDTAMVFGRWELMRANDRPGGLFTLVVRRMNGGWKIVSDHTSSDGEDQDIEPCVGE